MDYALQKKLDKFVETTPRRAANPALAAWFREHPGPRCPKCGGSALWLAMNGKNYCQRCRPPTEGELVLRFDFGPDPMADAILHKWSDPLADLAEKKPVSRTGKQNVSRKEV